MEVNLSDVKIKTANGKCSICKFAGIVVEHKLHRHQLGYFKGLCEYSVEKINTILLAYYEDQPVGCCINYTENGEEYYGVYVKPEFRRNGIASLLTQKMLAKHPDPIVYANTRMTRGFYKNFESEVSAMP